MHSSSDGFNENAILKINFRLPLNLTVEEARQNISALVEEGELLFKDSSPAYQADKNNILVRAFLQAIRTFTGKPGFLLKTGTSDMNTVGPVWSCPIVTYGPRGFWTGSYS